MVIDVQGQSSQVMQLDDRGQVINFTISDICAGGSGRFLEIIANVLQLKLEDIGPLSLESENPVTFTTGCAVFGESEAISRVSEGIPKEDILAGVHKALAGSVFALVNKVGLKEPCAISGGGGLNIGLIKRLNELGVQLLVPPQPQLINALGAAIIAEEPVV
jgi:predicted CoA-substrate-specific enzyme activase